MPINRRSILTAAAALPALTVPALANTAVAADPIFAAIERHRTAFLAHIRAGKIQSDLSGEAVDEARVVTIDTCEKCDAIAEELTTIQPTTMAGILALLDYVETFNDGAIRTGDHKFHDWRSAPWAWPEWEDDDCMNLFPYALMANIGRALEALTVRS